jgi:hypothetical protein
MTPLMLELLGVVLALLLVSPVRTEFISPHLQVYDELCELFTFDRAVYRNLMMNIVTSTLAKLTSLHDHVFAGAPQAMLQSCLTFGAFSFILEGLNKRQTALAHSVSFRQQTRSPQHDLPLLSLAIPIHDEIKGAFSSFCNSLTKPKKLKFPHAR